MKLLKYVNFLQEETINLLKMITFLRTFKNVKLQIEKKQ